MEQKTRKLMTMHLDLHSRDDVDRLYMSREDRRKELADIEDSYDASIQRLEDDIEMSQDGFQPPERIVKTRGSTETK